jgi:hypothetical protein
MNVETVGAELDAHGCAVLPHVLTPHDCAELVDL